MSTTSTSARTRAGDRRGRSTLRAAALLATWIVAACASNPPPGGQYWGFEAAARFWRSSPDGEVKITKGGKAGTGTSVELDRDLGIGTDYTPDFLFDLRAGSHRFGVEYLPIHQTGGATVDQTFVYRGTTFPAGDRIDADLKMTTWRLRYDYPVLQNGTADEVRAGLGAYVWTFDGSVDDKTSGTSASRSFTHVYPALFGSGDFTLAKGIFFEAGAGVAAGALDRKILDFDAALGFQVAQSARMSLGYRWLHVDFNETTNDGDFEIRGPYLALSFRF